MLALIQEGILEPGERLLTFDYMVASLLDLLLPRPMNGTMFNSYYHVDDVTAMHTCYVHS